MVWIPNGVPMIRKKNPGGDQRAVYFPACANHVGKAAKLGSRKQKPQSLKIKLCATLLPCQWLANFFFFS